jgi:predicted nucleotidyltransferase
MWRIMECARARPQRAPFLPMVESPPELSGRARGHPQAGATPPSPTRCTCDWPVAAGSGCWSKTTPPSATPSYSRPERIILFGSAERGELGRNSDIDLLVVKAGEYAKREVSHSIRQSLRHLGEAFDVVVATPEEIGAANRLTDYAVLTRYPLPDAVTVDEHREATIPPGRCGGPIGSRAGQTSMTTLPTLRPVSAWA